jgi:formylglycine-generating enzyme required for sulfatase activity
MQSGIQAAYGGGMSLIPKPPGAQDPKQAVPDVPRAPLMTVYGLAIVAGIFVGFALRLSRLRRALVGLTAFAALTALVLQTRSGFPIAESIAKENIALADQYDNENSDSPLTRGPATLVMYYTLCLYGAFALPIVVVAVVVAEGLCRRDWTTSIVLTGFAAGEVVFGVYCLRVQNLPDEKVESHRLVADRAANPRSSEITQRETSLGSLLIYCPPGSFKMGSPDAEKHRFTNDGQIAVTISKGFYLGKNSVTRAEFKALMGRAPWEGQPWFKEGDDLPATHVDWKDAAEFCRKLTLRESEVGLLPQGYVYALPTEAQREYACRAGTTTPYSFGDDARSLDEYAWWYGSVAEGDAQVDLYQPRRIGRKKPNPWGFCDMHGNVLEWCLDAFVEQFPGGSDPLVATGSLRALRGGCISSVARRCRSASRQGYAPSTRRNDVGFRVALVTSSPANQAIAPQPAGNRLAAKVPVEKQWKTSLGSILIECPSGSFTMGRALPEKGRGWGEDQVPVTISKGFYLGRYPVTQAEFEAVMGKTPWFPGWRPKIGVDCLPADLAPGGRLSGVIAWRTRIGDDCPATNVTWNDAAEFCRKLTARDSQAGRLPKGYAYALPTEGQWEYACRAGTTTAYWFGDDAEKLAEYAWCNGRDDGNEPYAHPIGQKKPNPWGLYDMRGNVWEMCRDGFTQQLPGGTDPFVAPTGGLRAQRGCTWVDLAISPYRSAYRGSFGAFPDARLGFRLALVPASSSDQTALPKSAASPGVPNSPPAKEWKSTIGTTLIYFPPGKFTMGSPGDWDGYGDAQVTISKRFFLGRNVVTQAEFKAVMGASPWKDKDNVQEGDDYPATYVDWNDATEFCRKLTARESKAGRLPKGYAYALPSEARWEYACRAGTETEYSFGKDSRSLSDYAWFCGNIGVVNHQPELYAQRVGQKKPNPWGFCDMHGNVLEWCRDAYGEKIPGGFDPLAQTGPYRSVRGASWFGSDRNCRTTDRRGIVPSGRSSELGFRLALVPVSQ